MEQRTNLTVYFELRKRRNAKENMEIGVHIEPLQSSFSMSGYSCPANDMIERISRCGDGVWVAHSDGTSLRMYLICLGSRVQREPSSFSAL